MNGPGRSVLAVPAALLLVLGGGLFGWHRHLDAVEDRPPAVDLSHGECRGALDGPGFTGLLGATHRVRVETQYRPGDAKSATVLACVVTGPGGRTLTVTARGAATEAERDRDEAASARADFRPFGAGRAGADGAVVRFTCATGPADGTAGSGGADGEAGSGGVAGSGGAGAGRTWYYLATVRLAGAGGVTAAGPGRQRTAGLAVDFARRAAERALGCTAPVGLPAGPVTVE
ncbi:hypothetical protein [Kitasatospora sp. NPDC088548]|uniref:hypothetical protein n=1 Tax=Kitasatospora sp. NPDC088548 TaxID=3364075 RepID=UPI003806EE88